jgi:phage-related protein
MPRIGPACHELRIRDADQTWRIVYHIGATEIVVLDVFKKKTDRTEKANIELSRARLRAYMDAR